MGKANGPGMFSALTHEELNALFDTLSRGGEAGRGNYGVASEIGELHDDVHRAIHEVTRAEFQARVEAARPEPEAEAEF